MSPDSPSPIHHISISHTKPGNKARWPCGDKPTWHHRACAVGCDTCADKHRQTDKPKTSQAHTLWPVGKNIYLRKFYKPHQLSTTSELLTKAMAVLMKCLAKVWTQMGRWMAGPELHNGYFDNAREEMCWYCMYPGVESHNFNSCGIFHSQKQGEASVPNSSASPLSPKVSANISNSLHSSVCNYEFKKPSTFILAVVPHISFLPIWKY